MNFSITTLEKLAAAISPVSSEIIQRESKMPILKVGAKDIRKVFQVLRDSAFEMTYLNSISGVHLTAPKEDGTLDLKGIEILYVVSSGNDFSTLAVRADLPEVNPEIDTIDDLYGSANWFEREIYDLLGVKFTNSQDLRRIMLPDDWQGHPLRRDYKENASYNGMSTTRVNELAAARIE